MSALWLTLGAWGLLTLGACVGWLAALGLHRDNCERWQALAYDLGWDAAVTTGTRLLRRQGQDPADTTTALSQLIRQWSRKARSEDYSHSDDNSADQGAPTWGGDRVRGWDSQARPEPAAWPSCPNCGAALTQDAAGVYCPAGCADTLLGEWASSAGQQLAPSASQRACHRCSETDAGLVCLAQLGGVCPWLQDTHGAPQLAPRSPSPSPGPDAGTPAQASTGASGRHSRAPAWRRVLGKLRHARAFA